MNPFGVCLFATVVSAQQPTYTNFTGFTPATSVDGQGGWTATNAGWDEEVVDLSGDLAWRVSNAFTTGSFGDQPIAPPSDLYAGEAGSTHFFDSAPAVTKRFYASFDIWSVTGATQPGLDVTVSPSDSMGSRQSFLSIEDNGAGIDLEFFDTQANHPVTNANGGFVSTDVATGLSYTAKHNIAFDITFVDGNVIDGGSNVFGNDIVKIYVNGNLVHTGTTWESYYWTTIEGQVPPQTRAIDTLLFRLSTPGPGTLLGGGYFIDNVFVSTKCPDDFQGFETDIKGWDVFSSPVFFPTRVPSGMDGITSASGAWHAIASATAGQVPAGNWGGYGANCECGSTSCAVTEFPLHGYLTSVDIYLDMEAGFADDTRFDFSSAINRPDGSHRRDFIFNAGFYSAGDPTLPGTGSDRFIVSASNNSGQPPFNPPADPIAITTTGWYTFQNRFYRTAGDVLAVDYMIRDAAGTLINQWTRSDPSDVIGVTVGGNRYGWFPTNGFDNLAFDNASRSVGGDGELALTVADCQDDAFPGEAGYQVEIQLEMLNLTSLATGFQAFLDYDMGTLLYRGDLSSYSASPFLQHISPVNQLDDGVLELDGSTAPLAPGTDADAVLATLVFDVTGTALCNPSSPAVFEAGGGFASEISFSGIPLATALTNPSAFTLDDTPPTLSPCPADITQSADANSALGCGGAFVTFTDPTATDNCDPSPSVVCTPASGSFFPTGISVVECVATDACGNISTCMFNVEVTATNDIDVVVELVGVNLPVSRCIYFQTTDSCGVTTDHEISFIDHDGDDANTNGIDDSTEGGSNTPSTPVRGVDTITVSCGVYTGLCAKDEQHTQWGNTVALTAGVSYTAGGVISLEGGDTDNDGDVDINDVTLLLSQFGSVVPSGTCPWDGTRDADFDNDSAVGALDYGFLVANWLTMSSCACTSPSVGFGPRRWLQVDGPTTAAVDFNRDGRVDAGDVEIFEQRHGLSGELSRRMRLGGR